MDDDKPFAAERAKTGRAACKKCKNKCETGELRLAKYAPNPFSESGGKVKHWYHLNCLFEVFKKQRAGTKVIESSDDIDGWGQLSEEDRDAILEGMQNYDPQKWKAQAAVKAQAPEAGYEFDATTKDNSFREFRRICAEVANESSYTGKTKILNDYFLRGSNKKKFEGDLQLWIKLLCPSAVPRIYNLQSKQLVKLFAKIFKASHSDMLLDLEQGDVSETIKKFFESSRALAPASKSTLTIKDIEDFLEKLSKLTQEDAQMAQLQSISKLCTSNDLLVIIRLIKQDLKINTGPKHILNALSPQAYTAFQSSRDLGHVVATFRDHISKNIIEFAGTAAGKTETFGIQLMSPISPMLAEACKSIERAIEKCPQGFYSEIKYDGERVQLHKRGDEFKFFSRNLKPVMEHKVKRLHQYIPKAFPNATDLILDSEIIVVDTVTGDLLPFGTLGVHKKTQFQSAEVCLFIFDCVYLNGNDLTKKPMYERRRILEEHIRPIKNHVQLSEYKLLKTKNELGHMIGEVLTKGLEGLVLKNINGIYEPGKRHWLKVKKDYLFEGQMADSADLVVIGAWYGTGKKGGMLSIFLMSCLNVKSRKWCTVTKVHGGLDDDELNKLQDELNPLMERSDTENLPKWLNCKRAMIPDLIAKDPYKMPVWEITGAEFSKAEIHTADGISIRFPRITKQRADKSPETATNLDELRLLFRNSKETVDLKLLAADCDDPGLIDDKMSITKQSDPLEKNPPTPSISACLPSSSTASPSKWSKKCDSSVMKDSPSRKRQSNKNNDDDDNDDDGGGTDVTNKSTSNRKKTKLMQELFDEAPASDEKKPINRETNAKSNHKNAAVKLKSDKKDGGENEGKSGKTSKRKPYADDNDIKNNKNSILKYIKATNNKNNSSASASASVVAATIPLPSSSTTQPVIETTKTTTATELEPVTKKPENDYDQANEKKKVKMENVKIEKLFDETPHLNNHIFDGVALYITMEKLSKTLDNELRNFTQWGGKVVHKPLNCTHAIHKHDYVADDGMNTLRRKYPAGCRHVTANWLKDCIEYGKLVPITKYPVYLQLSGSERDVRRH